jgi:hypothetical protein
MLLTATVVWQCKRSYIQQTALSRVADSIVDMAVSSHKPRNAPCGLCFRPGMNSLAQQKIDSECSLIFAHLQIEESFAFKRRRRHHWQGIHLLGLEI